MELALLWPHKWNTSEYGIGSDKFDDFEVIIYVSERYIIDNSFSFNRKFDRSMWRINETIFLT